MAEVCRENGVLLVVDAVICGFGRLGTWYAIERWDVVPDMIVFAKGVTSGYLPLGGVIVSDTVAEPFWDARRADAAATGRPTPAIRSAAPRRWRTSTCWRARACSNEPVSSSGR